MSAARLFIVSTLALGVSCAERERAASDHDRAWGPERRRAEHAQRAREALDPDTLATPEGRARIVGMPFGEVVARMGPVQFDGETRIEVARRGHDLTIVDVSEIRSGPDGDLRVVQKSPDGRLKREAIRVGGAWYVRHEGGRLQTTDYDQRRRLRVQDEVFGALSTALEWLDPALAWRAKGAGAVRGRPARGYSLALAPDAPVLKPDPEDAPLRAKVVDGEVWVDAETGVVLRARVEARLAFADGPGRFEMAVTHAVRPAAPRPFDVADASEPPARPPVDLEPLGFLEELSRTSTVIGGDEP